MPAAALGAIALALLAFAAIHLGHYVDRAQANERTLLAELMAQPVCTGTPARQSARVE